MSHLRRLAVALLVAALVPASALAQRVQAPPPPSPRSAQAPAPNPAAHFVARLGFDLGFEKLYEVPMEDGSTRSITANQGVNLALGAAFLKLGGGRFVTEATIGIEYSGVEASNGSLSWIAVPLEVIEFVHVDPLRLGAGISYLIAPGMSGDGVAEGIELDLKNSLGLVFQSEWVWRQPRASGSAVTAGLRFVWQKLEPEAGGPTRNANAIGFVLGWTR